jgi:hypothetical protein
MAESYVQVAPDSTGKKIRNLQMDVLQPDGTTATVQMQVTSLVDMDGRATDFGISETNHLLHALLREMTALRKMYGRATGQQFLSLDGAMLDDTVG